MENFVGGMGLQITEELHLSFIFNLKEARGRYLRCLQQLDGLVL